MQERAKLISRYELISIICDLGKELESLRQELLKAKKDLEWARDMMVEVQEKNRRLEWTLTKVEEKR